MTKKLPVLSRRRPVTASSATRAGPAAALLAAPPSPPPERAARGGGGFEGSLRFALGLTVLLGSRALRTLEEPAPGAGDEADGSGLPGLSAAAVHLLDGDVWRHAYRALTASAHDFARTVVRSGSRARSSPRASRSRRSRAGSSSGSTSCRRTPRSSRGPAGRETALSEDVGRAAKQLSIFRRNYEIVALARKAPRSFRRLATLCARPATA